MRSNKPKTSDGTDNGEKSQEDENQAVVVEIDEADRCPICLNLLLWQELAVPESCCHVFCLSCILKWAETVTSCPVDRKPFQAIYKRDATLGCIKIPMKEKASQGELQACCCNKEKEKRKGCLSHCNGTSRRRNVGNKSERVLLPKVVEDPNRKCNSIIGNECKKDTTAVRKKKVSRGTCSQQLVRSDFSSTSSSRGQLSGSCISITESCADFLDVYEGEPLLQQKRCRLETHERPWLSVSGAIPVGGLLRQRFDPCEVLNDVFPLRSLLPDSTSPANPPAAGHFIFLGKECAVTCSKGEEKKSASRTSSTKGSKKKTETSATRRRSTRNSRTDDSPPVQDPSSPQSNHSDSDSSVTNTSTRAGGTSKKPERQTAKRKPKQPTKEKRLVKRKTRTTRNASKKPASSPEESDAEHHDEEDEEEEEEKEAAEGSESLLSDGEQNPNAQTGDSSQHSNQEDNGTGTSGQNSEHEDCDAETSAEMSVNDKNKDSSPEEEESSSQNHNLPLSSEEEEEEEKQDDEPESKLTNETPLASDEEVSKDPPRSPSSEEAYVPEDENDCRSPEERAFSHGGDSPSSPPDIEEAERAESPSEKEDSMSPNSNRPYSPVDIDMDADKMAVDENMERTERASEKQPSPLPDKPMSEVDKEPDTCSNDIEGSPRSDGEDSVQADQPNEAVSKEPQVEMDDGEKSLEESESLHVKPMVAESVDSEENNGEAFSEDNNEMVPMECDSPGSEQPETKNDQEKKRDNAVSETVPPVTESQASEEDKKTELKSQEETSESSTEQKKTEKKEGRQRKSRFHSPSTTWSPKRESRKERRRSRSRSRERDATPPSRRRSRTRSRDRDSDRDGQKSDSHRRDRSRERERRGRRRSRSRSRSRTYARGSSPERPDRSERPERTDRAHSPWRRDRWSNDNWRNSRGSDRPRRNDQEKQGDCFGKESSEPDNEGFPEIPPERGRTENPDWVKEQVKTDDSGVLNESRWDENKKESTGDSWTRNFSPGGWKSDRGRGGTRGRGSTSSGFRGGFGQGEPAENRWQQRNSFSGISNNSGNDSYSRFNENRTNRRKGEQDFVSEPPVDRSGWSSASSWAVRRTLPADVQNYYSRRGRNSAGPTGGWMRPDEETPGQDANASEPNSQPSDGQQLPVNVMHHPLNVIPAPISAPPLNTPPVNILQFPLGVPTPAMNMQSAPFNMSHQLPVHLHSTVPLLQVPAPASQGLPPPPPPPPPSQQANFLAAQNDGKPPQAMTSAQGSNKFSAPLLPTPTKAPASSVQGPPSGILPSSTTQSSTSGRAIMSKESIRVEANADSSKKEKKQQIQEKAIQEVKLAIKPYYQNKDITKDEYKEIVRKAVDKVCHSKSGEVNSGKVANLVKAYVDKYKHARKNKSDDHGKF
ncbi:protein SCAF11 isoform X2 [Amia ocellicauda]|uniref:protein SCAF11 isoform X2 n=1 Tax=Amia ocellicauda TaxID=2972642 RepID=UPI003464DAB2